MDAGARLPPWCQAPRHSESGSRERVLEALPLLDGETVDHKLLGLRKADSILQRLPSAFFRSPTSSFTDASQGRETAPETVGSSDGRLYEGIGSRTIRNFETQKCPLSCENKCTPNGIRTRAATLKGWCPRPLDDGGRDGTAYRPYRRRPSILAGHRRRRTARPRQRFAQLAHNPKKSSRWLAT